jgi:hypothetical protein
MSLIFVLFTALFTALFTFSLFISASGVGLIAPIYDTSLEETWSELIEAHEVYPDVPIIAAVNVTALGAVFNLKANGIDVVIYMSPGMFNVTYLDYILNATTFNERAFIKGVFFDVPPSLSFYQNLSGYMHQLGFSLTVGNAKMNLPNSYIGVMDITCLSDQPSLPSTTTLTSYAFPVNQTCVIATNTSSPNDATLINLIQHAGWIYLTDSYPNTPTYLLNLVDRMSMGGASTTTGVGDGTGSSTSAAARLSSWFW